MRAIWGPRLKYNNSLTKWTATKLTGKINQTVAITNKLHVFLNDDQLLHVNSEVRVLPSLQITAEERKLGHNKLFGNQRQRVPRPKLTCQCHMWIIQLL